MNIRIASSLKTAVQDPFLLSVEKCVNEILPPNLKEQIQNGKIPELLKALPILKSSEVSDSFWVTLLCQAEYTQGVGRYLNDALSRWLVPGKNLTIMGSNCLNFQFVQFPRHRFFLAHVLIGVEQVEDVETIVRNLAPLLEEIRLNILAVYHARYIASLRSISLDQKNLIIRENINKILNLNPRDLDQSLFDQMHSFLMKVTGEQKMGQVKKTIAQLMQSRPKSFDREVFYEMTHFTVLFKNQFASKRDPKHVSRVIALHYLFKKDLLDSIDKPPTERHISLKVLKTNVSGTQPVLGILLGISILRDNERFDRAFLFNAIKALLLEIEFVKESYICDRREEKASFLYLEVQKTSGGNFQLEEIKALRQNLTKELKRLVENDVHPIFLPRNEEDVARNLILLSQQLKFSRDLPQASIHYEKQTDSEILFSILLVRLLLPNTMKLRELIFQGNSNLKFYIDEAREIGKLKRRIPKEAAILRISLEKAPFFRPDYSVDLLRARQRVAYELSRIVGEYRDFNGGMILKQEESLLALRKELGPMPQETEFLLEDYFYSLRPGIMQTVLPTEILEAHFRLLKSLSKKRAGDPYQILENRTEKFHFFFVGADDGGFKDQIDIEIEKLQIPSYELATCFLHLSSLSAAGYLLRSDNEETATSLKRAIQHSLKKWSETLYCPVKAI
jgi:hypothetical protein